MRGCWWAMLLLVVGCGDKDNGAGDSGRDGTSCALDDPFTGIEGNEHACGDSLYYDQVSGATSYYVGDFHLDGDVVSGTETWVLFANDAWLANGGRDCKVVWTASGTSGTAVNRGDLSFDLSLSVDESVSDCPTDRMGNNLWDGVESMDVVYDVKAAGCDSKWFFSESGNELGKGGISARRATYLSNVSCLFF